MVFRQNKKNILLATFRINFKFFKKLSLFNTPKLFYRYHGKLLNFVIFFAENSKCCNSRIFGLKASHIRFLIVIKGENWTDCIIQWDDRYMTEIQKSNTNMLKFKSKWIKNKKNFLVNSWGILEIFQFFANFRFFAHVIDFFQVNTAENFSFSLAQLDNSDALYPRSFTSFKVGENWGKLKF